MRETFDMMNFVNAVYVIGIGSTAMLVGWSWMAMRQAERKREETRGK